jgi:hypothetical protein
MDGLGEVRGLILDFKRVIAVKGSACRLLEQLFDLMFRKDVSVGIVHTAALPEMRRMEASLARNSDRKLRIFDDSDLALEWAEGQLLEGVTPDSESSDEPVSRADYELFKGLSGEELKALEPCLRRQAFQRGAVIVHAGSDARELFFLAAGSVSVMVPLPSGASKRVATFCPGMAFGEMALIDGAPRSATVLADSHAECDILSLAAFDQLSQTNPQIKITVLKNLCLGVSNRLREANRHLSIFE